MNDIILERAKNGFCPICNQDEDTRRNFKDVEVDYKGQKIIVCERHIKMGDENVKTK